MKVLVTGATGFVGREVLRQLGAAGHKARILARNVGRARETALAAPASAGPERDAPHTDWLKPELQTAQPEIISGNVLHLESLRGAADGCDAVIHLVGIISEVGEQTFENVHLRATQNVLVETKRAGVKRWVQMSALGTRPNAAARYHQTKWLAEEAVRSSGLDWTILRPSVIYGPEDHFVNLFAGMARWSPIVPVIGDGKGLLQPISVENVARCFVGALTEPRSIGRTLEVCGSERLTHISLLNAIFEAMGRRRLKLRIPLPVARLQAAVLETVFPRLLGKAPPLSRDQLLMLQEDNVGDATEATNLFQLDLRRFREDIKSYLGNS